MLTLIKDKRTPPLVPLLKVNKKNGISKMINLTQEGRNRGKEGENRPKLLILVKPQEVLDGC